jgi:hypothetical protein
MKMFVLSISIILVACIICVSIFFNKRNNEIIVDAKHNSNTKLITTSGTNATSNGLSVDFAPAKENLLNRVCPMM